ncbi:hypothetical protein [Bacillus paranthracis]|uniref:hypothetical protein n=1 Tax=Bacillus paranthracis TaxID=2026186 RepID=UPI002550A044|nr:hypothetical protein [Bacillus paranthracis]MDK7443418.1 hypothetical protein [Bacillus paranthracis]MDK7458517.1 hypothetical protein [Bacillus paranthracis]
MRKVEITVEERLVSSVSYEFTLPEHISEKEMDIIIARVEALSDCADDVVHLLEKEISGLEVKKTDELGPEVAMVEIIDYDIEEK